jgi:aryl-alcohol dehydrogenase
VTDARVVVPADPAAMLSVGLIEMQARGLSFKGIVEGDSNPDVFIPWLIEMYQAGTFPFRQDHHDDPVRQDQRCRCGPGARRAVKVVLVHS